MRTWALVTRGGGLRAQVGEHGEHPAVVVVSFLETELAKDRPYVTLDRALAEDDPLADPGVRAALGHQGQALTLALG